MGTTPGITISRSSAPSTTTPSAVTVPSSRTSATLVADKEKVNQAGNENGNGIAKKDGETDERSDEKKDSTVQDVEIPGGGNLKKKDGDKKDLKESSKDTNRDIEIGGKDRGKSSNNKDIKDDSKDECVTKEKDQKILNKDLKES